MLSTRKGLLGLLAIVAALAATIAAFGQDYNQLQGQNGKQGRTFDPVNYGPGVANLTWFWPNDQGGNARPTTLIRDNNSNATGRFQNGGANVGAWTVPGFDSEAAYFFTPTPVGLVTNPPVAEDFVQGSVNYDQARGAGFPQPAYEFAGSVPSALGSHKDPTTTAGGPLKTFVWTVDPAAESATHPTQGYQLYVWLPNGPTGPVGGPFVYPNRYYVFTINYGAGGSFRWVDVVDTNVAGQGWIRLGNGGMPTNQLFQYDGTTPIRITLYNTQWRDAFDNLLEDTTVPRAVYADAVMAVPDTGYVTATPIVAQIGLIAGNGQRNQVVEARNLNFSTYSGGVTTTVTTPEVDAFLAEGTNPAGNAPIWTWTPLSVTPFTTSMDNTDATADLGWTSSNLTNHAGVDYLKANITNTATGAPQVMYAPTLDDGNYLIQVYCGGNGGGDIFATQTTVYVFEGATVTPIQINQSVPGWVNLGTQRFQHRGTLGQNLRVAISSYSPNVADLGHQAYADQVRFIGSFNETINSTPVQTKALITPQGGGTPIRKDVVLVACDDGHLYCLDALGNGNGTTTLYWSYPSILPAGVQDPNQANGIDGIGAEGEGVLADMPSSGFALGSPLVQHINNGSPLGIDYCYIAARNGRVYCIDMSGRGDYNASTGIVGTTDRVWTFPDDYPAAITKKALPGFGGSVSTDGTHLFVPSIEGRLYAVDLLPHPNRTTVANWMYPAMTVQHLGALSTTPTVDFGRVYFGTAPLNDTVTGQFYALDANTGHFDWSFAGDPNTSPADAFRGGPCTATAAQLQIANNMVFCSNDNLFVYGLDADTGAMLWQSSELNSTVTGHLMFARVSVPDLAGTSRPFPLVMIPTDDGRFDGFFARPADINFAGLKQAWEYVSGSSQIVASMSNGRNFMYGADMSGNMFAWSQNTGIGGMGSAPGSPTLTANNPVAQRFANAKIIRLSRTAYQGLRLSADSTGETAPLPWTHDFSVSKKIQRGNPDAMEWGETAYFLVYDFPFLNATLGNNTPINPPIVQFQIGVTGATVRQYGVQSKQFAAQGNPPKDANGNIINGYAILAFPIQGAGATSLPPGAATVRATFSTSAGNENGQQQNVSFNASYTFNVANPLGLYMPDANGNISAPLSAGQIGTNPNPSDPQRGTNGSGANPLLAQSEGVANDGQTGSGHFWLVDMSMLVLLKGGTRGLEQVRMNRPDLVWQGGSGAVYKPLDSILYPNFEDLPVNSPNSSLDYPDIDRSYLRATKDPNGTAENAVISSNGFSLIPPILPANYDESNAELFGRGLQPVYMQIDVDVPRFQPFNKDPAGPDPNLQYFRNSENMNLPSGYLARINAYVDSNGNSLLDNLGGRREANRAFTTTLAVGLDDRMSVTTPTVDLGTLAEGTGYAPSLPGLPGSGNAMSPWGTAYSTLTNIAGVTVNPITTTNQDYLNLWRPFHVENDGNVNETNVRLAKGVVGGPAPGPWPIYSNSVDDLGWLDTSQYVWTNFDWNFGLMPKIIIQKARVGDTSPTELSINPPRRLNQNIGVAQAWLFPNGPKGNDALPMIAATPPIGFPVGLYSQPMQIIEDNVPFVAVGRPGNQALDVDGGNNALEVLSNPTFTVKLNVRESRLTGSFSLATAPMVDYPLGPVNAQNLSWASLQPAALRTPTGSLLVAWTSPRDAYNSALPSVPQTDPQYRIYLASLAGTVPGGTSPLGELGAFVPGAANRWFRQEVGPFPVGPYDTYFQTGAGESLITNSAKFTAPALPSNGMIDPLGGPNFNVAEMAFLGQIDKQTSAGRSTEYRIMAAGVGVNGGGATTVNNVISMPFDPNSPKGKPSIYQVQGGAVIFYAATGTGEGQIFYTVTDGTNFSQPALFSVGNGFEEVGAPNAQIRSYQGTGGAKPIMELSFTGKLRGEPNSEIFYCRSLVGSTTVNGNTINNTPGTQLYLTTRTNEPLVPGDEAGTYRSVGVVWNMAANANFVVSQSLNGGVAFNIEVPGTRTIDRQSGLIQFSTTLGGQAYVDPNLGTVRFSTTLPIKTAQILLTYTPRFLRVSEAKDSGHASPTVLWDNRIAGDVSNYSYWFNAASNGSLSNVSQNSIPRTSRYVFTYTQAASGAGKAARPFLKTMRLGVQLPTSIATDSGGNLVKMLVFGSTGPVQVDPANGRVYFQTIDEDRFVKVFYTYTNPVTGTQTLNVVNATVSLIVERGEGPVPIDQAVNESAMAPFLDPFDSVAPYRRPGLIWMFYTSTRAGSADLYFETMAPRFTPTINGK